MSAQLEFEVIESRQLPESNLRIVIYWDGKTTTNGDRYAAKSTMVAYPMEDIEVWKPTIRKSGLGDGLLGLGRLGISQFVMLGEGLGYSRKGLGTGEIGNVEDPNVIVKLFGIFRDGLYEFEIRHADVLGNESVGLKKKIQIIGTDVRTPALFRISSISGKTINLIWQPSPDVLVNGG